MKSRSLILLAVLGLSIPLIALITVQGQPSGCPLFVRYLGNEIYLSIDGSYARVRAWFSPFEIDWEIFRSQCFDQNPSYWYSDLIIRVAAMFSLAQVQLLDYGIDNSSRQVYVWVGFYFSWSGYYSEEDGVLKFRDVYKPYGSYFDEVHVYSDREVYGWEPTPSRYTSWEAHWYNPNYDAAPSWYTIYLWPVYRVTVRIEGLPSAYRVPVSIDGRLAGYVSGGSSSVFRVTSQTVSVSVQAVFDVDGTSRYRVEQDTIKVSAGEVAMFRYYREFLVQLDTSPSGIELSVAPGGPTCRSPCSIWVREGDVLNMTAPESVLESVAQNVRTYYVFAGWSDGFGERSRSITVRSPLNLTASYTKVKEYYVSVTASPPEAAGGVRGGSGWYREGTVVIIWANETVYVSDYERLRFAGWSTGEASRVITKTIDSPFSIEARYYWEYRIEVVSNVASTRGSGWYPRGEVARVSVEGLRDGYYYGSDERVRWGFLGWEVVRGGIQAPSSPSFSFEVSEPVILSTRFGRPEYRVCIDGNCAFLEEKTPIPARADEAVLGELLVRRFTGYLDPSGRNLGTRVVVVGPLELRSSYATEVNWPLLALVLLAVALAPIAALWLLKGREGVKMLTSLLALKRGAEGTEVREAEKETEVVETLKVEEELARVEGYLVRLEELYQRGEVKEEVYRRLREEYESRKRELERMKKGGRGRAS